MKTLILGILLLGFNIFTSQSKITPLFISQNNTENYNPVSVGGELFIKYCSECHGISEEVYGPPLKDIEKRRTKEWIISFVLDEEKLMKTDAIAKQLYEESEELHTAFSSELSTKQVEQVLKYIKEES